MPVLRGTLRDRRHSRSRIELWFQHQHTYGVWHLMALTSQMKQPYSLGRVLRLIFRSFRKPSMIAEPVYLSPDKTYFMLTGYGSHLLDSEVCTLSEVCYNCCFVEN